MAQKAKAKAQAARPQPARRVPRGETKATEKSKAKTPAAARSRPGSGVPNVMDPLHSASVPAVLSSGNSLPHTSLVSTDFQVDTANRRLLVITNTGNSGTVGFIYKLNPNGFQIGEPTPLTIPTLSVPDFQGGASAGRAMKCSVSVVNCTNALKRAGRVTYINSSQRLPGPGGTSEASDYDPVMEGIKSSPYRRRIMGDTLATAKQLVSYPIDIPAYERYEPWRGTVDVAEFQRHAMAASVANAMPGIASLNQRPMSVIAFVFDPVSDEQEYSVTIRASFYTRWPLTTVPGQTMRPASTAHPAVINAIINKAEAAAHDLMPVGEGAAAAAFAPSLMRNFGGTARGLLGAARAGQGAISTLAIEAGEVAPLLAPLLL